METKFRKRLERLNEEQRLARYYKQRFIEGLIMICIVSVTLIIIESDTVLKIVQALINYVSKR